MRKKHFFSPPLFWGGAVALLLILVSLLASPPVLASPSGPVWSVDNKAEWDAATETFDHININAPGQLEVENTWTLLWEDTTEYTSMSTMYSQKTTVGTWAVTRYWYKWDVELRNAAAEVWTYGKLGDPDYVEAERYGSTYGVCSCEFGNFDPREEPVYLKSGAMSNAYMRNNQVYGLDYYAGGNWESVVWDSGVATAQQILTFNTNCTIAFDEGARVSIGVDTDNDGNIDVWSDLIPLDDGANELGAGNFGLPAGYRYAVKFTLESGTNGIAGPEVLDFELSIAEPEWVEVEVWTNYFETPGWGTVEVWTDYFHHEIPADVEVLLALLSVGVIVGLGMIGFNTSKGTDPVPGLFMMFTGVIFTWWIGWLPSWILITSIALIAVLGAVLWGKLFRGGG